MGKSGKTKSLQINKTTRSNLITYGIVIAAYIIVEILISGGHMSSLMKGLLVPLCIYTIMAVSLNLTVGILGELSLGHAWEHLPAPYFPSVCWIRFPLQESVLRWQSW